MAFETLLEKIKAQIRRTGFISVQSYMDLCLSDPVFGYYQNRDPLGVDGDFTTAPEISQMFGEIIAAFLFYSWEKIGSPQPFDLIEFGPGRGTLMHDISRTAQKICPAFLKNVQIHLIETSPHLKALQRKTLDPIGANISWENNFFSIPEGKPVFVIANEFFDALPVRQFVFRTHQWRERVVFCKADGGLVFTDVPLAPPSPSAMPEPELMPGNSPQEGDIFEWPVVADTLWRGVVARIKQDGGLALIIDYGSLDTRFGDTLQAVSKHAYVNALENPGEHDLTVHVDFARMKTRATKGGLNVCGGITQHHFLKTLGLSERARVLMQNASKEQAARILLDAERLIATDQMGTLFKVLAATTMTDSLPGF